MANRFSVGDTLGAQLYSQVISNQTQRYLQEKALEEERQRREAERRRQEEQRRKASDHGAFGQTLQTIGQVGGAIIGAKYGGAEGAVIGSNLGSAGASTIMNLFPNVGGTEPSGDNPYYNKPSDMAKFSSTLNTGLQAYGAYSKAAAAEEQKKFTQKVTADIADQTKRFREGDTSAFNYYGATPTEIQKHIETNISGWDDAKGFFGDKLLNSDVSLSMANTIHQNMVSRLGQQMQFANSLTDTSEKQKVFTNLEGLYGQNYSDFIPKGGSDAIRAGIQQNITKANRATAEVQTNNFDELAQLALESAKLGNYDASVFLSEEAQANPERARQYKALADSYVREATLKKQNAQTKATLDLQKDQYDLSLKALENTPKDSEMHPYLVDITSKLAEDAIGISDGQALFSQLGKDVKATEDPTAKSIQDNAKRFVDALMNPNRTTDQALTKEEAIAVILNSHAQKDAQGNFRRETLSPIGEAMLRQLVKDPDIENEINSINLTNAYESAQKKQQERLGLWNRTLNFFGFGESEPDVSETQLNNNASAIGNPALLNNVFRNVPSLNGR
jgi:hypothetical protein